HLDKRAYDQLEKSGNYFEKKMQSLIDENDYPLTQHRVGSMFSLFFSKGPIRNVDDVNQCDFKRFNQYFHSLLDNGIYIAPSQYESGFISLAHQTADLENTIYKIGKALKQLYN
ncbi:MAG: aspartate aminotransferase family protein, partial [Planctomycetia bacterium]|nr:aspartate aminotransferase family protein [Planctomycetia bacterium]